MRRAAATFLAFLALSGCTREEARARLQDDIHADTIDIIHARFPCHSPDLHFFRLPISRHSEGGVRRRRHLLEYFDAAMDLAHPPGADSLPPQPSQLASAVASTKKSLLANLRNLDGRAQPSPNAIPVARKIKKGSRPVLPAQVVGGADGGLSDRTTMVHFIANAKHL
jgi:hypothetical protein